MSRVFSSLARHSGIYALGQIVGRLASILLLPILTRYLSPADYGCIALIDLTTGLLAIVIGSGMASAVSRYHFEANDRIRESQIWWTGLTFVAVTGSLIVLPALASRSLLERVILGASQKGGAYLALALPTLWFGVLSQLLETELRVRKRSLLFLAISLGRLFFNIGLNLTLLIGMSLGATAILIGNLVSQALVGLVMAGIFTATHGRYRFDTKLIIPLLRFGSPLVITTLLAAIMHDADRYFLRVFMDVSQVGIYSVAYTIGMAINTCYLAPFLSIWIVSMYEIQTLPDPKPVYARIFQLFMDGLAWLILAVCLFSRPLLNWILPREFAGAADLVPVVCIAYFFFSMNVHFSVPAMVSKKTGMLLPASVAAAVVNVAANMTLIPMYGLAGAAWASVATFVVFSFFGLVIYRRIDRIEYPLVRCGLVLLGIMATVSLVGWAQDRGTYSLLSAIWAFAIWVAWGWFLFGSLLSETIEQSFIRAHTGLSQPRFPA